ncbi:MAG: hypothetical protein KDA84_08275, partial [Planctomycetaceae bacterium]|nr:hypothetical protein [Planctomycetaceae bacterium]
HDPQGKPVPGTITVGKNESTWEFHPKTPWQPVAYKIAVDEMLEDLAGNTPLRLFDTDLVQPQPTAGQRTLTFQPQ